jgi:adenylate kinase
MPPPTKVCVSERTDRLKGGRVRLLLIGPPGSGKGTQAARIGNHYGIAHISSGELLRGQVDLDTPTGRAVREQLARGDLVSDGIVMDLLRRPVEAAGRRGGYVLDGFPRTVAQAKAAYLIARELGVGVQVALYLRVPREQLIERMVARRRVSGRADDSLDVIERRLNVFDEQTTPLLDYYAGREVLVTVDGSKSADDVTAAAFAELDQARPALR